MKMGLTMVLIGHVNFLLGALVHGVVLRHINLHKQARAMEYAISNVVALTSGLLVSLWLHRTTEQFQNSIICAISKNKQFWHACQNNQNTHTPTPKHKMIGMTACLSSKQKKHVKHLQTTKSVHFFVQLFCSFCFGFTLFPCRASSLAFWLLCCPKTKRKEAWLVPLLILLLHLNNLNIWLSKHIPTPSLLWHSYTQISICQSISGVSNIQTVGQNQPTPWILMVFFSFCIDRCLDLYPAELEKSSFVLPHPWQ